MADRYWVGGTASWDGTAGTKWALTSGGAGGQAIPTSADDVFFDAASGANTVTIATGNTGAKSINCTGFTGTLAGTAAITVSGSVTLVAGMTVTYSGTLTLAGTGTLTSAGKTLGVLAISNSGTIVTLGDALVLSSGIQINNGTFNTANFNITCQTFQSSNSNTRTISLGSSTVTITINDGTTAWTFATSTGLTFNAGTSTINISGRSVMQGGSQIYNNVSFTNTAAGNKGIAGGSNTFNNLTVAGPSTAGLVEFTIPAPQTINGILSTTGTAGNRRVWFRGATYGIAQTLTVNSTPSLTDADFRDIYVIGSAAPISGTRIGDLRGCSGITFSTPKTVYWVTAGGGSWSGNNWAAASGGAASTDNFSLAQDTAIIENTGLNASATVTMDAVFGYTGTVSMGTRTNAMTLSLGAAQTLYGNWTNGSGVTLSGAQTLTFSGRNTQTITSAGKTFSGAITIDSYGGTVELADAFNIGASTLTVTNGTFDTKNFNVTAGSLSSNNSNVREIRLGSSTVTLSATGAISLGTVTNLTFSAGTSTITSTRAGDGTVITSGGVSFYNVSLPFGGATSTTVTGVNTFNNLTMGAPGSGIVSLLLSANQTITGTLTVAGATAVRRIFLCSDTLGTTRTLTVGTLSATDCDFRDITIAGTAAGSSPTRAGDCGRNMGITFPAPKTAYWNLAGAQNWSATGWAPSSGGTVDINQFPLAQDTAVFDNTGSVGTVTIDAVWNIGTFDASLRTTAMTLTTSTNSPFVYGDWKFGTGVTSSSATGIINFGKSGTQTITSNGVQFGCPIRIESVTGLTQLADALSLNSARSLEIRSGGFDAVSYNVTVGTFNAVSASTGSVVKMGSGTWTLSGTGSVWGGIASGVNFYKGTANIVLSDTSTSARTFNGNGLSYNKLTIGGATGISTLTITGNNQFTELASTKTVAHTIAFGSTTQITFNRWTITGTAGNVVTISTPLGQILAGPCVSGVDYLAISGPLLFSGSNAEFYAGANSTGTAGAPVYFTTKPADSTRYWVGGTGNWGDTAKWSETSGGSGGASVPRSHDDVIFNSASSATSYTSTINTVSRIKSLTVTGPASGNLTLAGTFSLTVQNSITLPATGLATITYSGTITLSGSGGGKTITTNGRTLDSSIIIEGDNPEWSLGSDCTLGSNLLTVTSGTFNTSNYTLSCSRLISNNSNTRSINLGSSTVTLSNTASGLNFSNSTNLSFNAGTSSIIDNGGKTSIAISADGLTFYNVSLTAGSNTAVLGISGSNTFNNLTFDTSNTAGALNIPLGGNQTINGTLTISATGSGSARYFVRSDTQGVTRTITAAAVSLQNVDFEDITIAGAAAPASGTRIGDCKGNSGITFTPAAPKYWNLAGGGNWNSTAWALTSGGTPVAENFPLPQDTCIFEATGLNSGATVTINSNYNIGTVNMSARTANTMTLATGTNNVSIYGNWINGTGTTLTGTGTLTFEGRTTQQITSAGKTWTQLFTINNPGSSVVLQDAFTASQSSANVLNVTSGTFNAATYNVTLSGAASGVSSSNSNTRTIGIGSGTWTIAGTNGWTATTSTGLTVTGTGTISLTSASAKTFAGGDIAYTNITLNQGGAGALTITGNNTFKDITNTYKATGATNITMGTTTQRVSQWTAAGEVGRLLTIQGTSTSSPCALVHTGTGTAANVDYLVITGVRAY